MPVLSGVGGNARVPRPSLRQRATLAVSIAPGINVENAPNAEWPFFNGVRFIGEACGHISVDAIDCSDYSRDASETAGDEVDFDPFVVYVSRECAYLGGLTDAELTALNQARLREDISFQLAKELYSGDVTGNPAIKKSPVVLETSAAVPLLQAIQILEEKIATDFGNILGYIHVTPAALVALVSERIVDEDDNNPGIYYTPTGHVVIADAGYDGGDPTGSPVDEDGAGVTPDTAGDGEEWLYATGPIAWDYGPEQSFDLTETNGISERSNKRTALVQRPALAIFDPSCIHLAVLAVVTS